MSKGIISAVLGLNFCASLIAASAVTEAEIYSWLAIWQQREGLEQRNIRLRFVHQRELELGRNIVAEVQWATPDAANIRFVYPEELETVFGDTPALARDEAQRVVIHELMHLVVAGLYDDGSGKGHVLLASNPASVARLETITNNLAVMLLRRRVPGGVSEVQFIRREINSGPWKPSADVKKRVMLQVVRAMNAATEHDVMALFERR